MSTCKDAKDGLNSYDGGQFGRKEVVIEKMVGVVDFIYIIYTFIPYRNADRSYNNVCLSWLILLTLCSACKFPDFLPIRTWQSAHVPPDEPAVKERRSSLAELP